MRVLIDCRFSGVATGLGRYTRELTKALLERQDDIEYVLLVREDPSPWLGRLLPEVIIADIPHYSLAEQRMLPSILKKSKADLFYSMHFNVPWRCPVPFIATIHDLILHSYPNSAPLLKRAAYRILMHHTVRRARHLITVSDFVREEVARAYGSKILKKSTTVYEGVADTFVPQNDSEQQRVRQKYGLSDQFFLYVGNAKQHKNVQLLIDAFLRANLLETHLVLVSGGPELDRLRLGENIVVLRDVPDADLAPLYTSAKALVTASLYEGFGLPPLEALHCGCPVIAVDGGAIAEIVQEDGLLLPPTREAFTEAFLNPPSHPGHISDRWTWQKTARETALLLRELV